MTRSDRAALPTLPIAGQLLPDGRYLRSRLCRRRRVLPLAGLESGVAAVPPSAFYLDPATAPLLARFCFAKTMETIAEAAD